jgi:purine-binding chemotaxis protein CheW
MSTEVEAVDSKIDDLHMVFMINNQKYALSSKYIIEIIEIMPITMVPFLPEYMKGIINLRSTIIPVMDARLRFGMNPIPYDERTCIIIIENDINKMGLIVDAVNEFITIQQDMIMESRGDKKDLKDDFISGISQINNDIQLILDCESLIEIMGDVSNEINE